MSIDNNFECSNICRSSYLAALGRMSAVSVGAAEHLFSNFRLWLGKDVSQHDSSFLKNCTFVVSEGI